jgi:hypothetical protein
MDGDRNNTSSVRLRDILGAQFCANKEFRLVLFDRLPSEQQECLRDLTKDPDFYGVLLPPEGSPRKIKSVSQSSALLLLTLTEPGTIPAYVQKELGPSANEKIAELLLDELLMIEHNGAFVCGSDAYDLLYTEPIVKECSSDLSLLSRQALEYGQMLELDDIDMLSGRLYAYNRAPLSSRWQKLLPDSDGVARWLGIKTLRSLLQDEWASIGSANPTDAWFSWRSVKPPKEASLDVGHKLYVSPMPDAVREAFPIIVECIAESDAHHFKVGNDAYGILRPDKIVIYFRSFDSLRETGRAIANRLSGCPPQGVPFTAALDGSSLLSWGIDPPPQKGVLAWQVRESWRQWITNKIAASVIAAQQSRNKNIPPWRFALERLRLDGINTDTWVPLPEFGRSIAIEVAQ